MIIMKIMIIWIMKMNNEMKINDNENNNNE